MTDAFSMAWSVAKVDFLLDPAGMPKSRYPGDYYGVSYIRPETYNYRVPTGKDAEGDLIYGPREHEVTDQSFVHLPHFERYGEDLGPLRRPPSKPPEEGTLEDYGLDLSQYDSEKDVPGRRIMDTTTHEAIHDADPVARWFDKTTGRPTFGARGDRGSQINRIVGTGGIEQGQQVGVFSPWVGSTVRDQDFAAETMAFLSEYGEAPGKANLRILNHPDVDRVDRRWLLNRLADARKRAGIADDASSAPELRRTPGMSPERILDRYGRSVPAYVPQPRDEESRKLTGTHALDTEQTANFTVPKSQQIRRNLINAVNEMAMTRMHESGEFLEDHTTSQDSWEEKRQRPSAAKMKAAKRETKDARRVINAHWKKVEAGKAPVPNSMEDLPENVQRLIGQQQIRSVLGLQRGRASEAIDEGYPATIITNRLLDTLDSGNLHGFGDPSKEWEALPLEEREEHLREYLTDLDKVMNVGTRWVGGHWSGHEENDYQMKDIIWEELDQQNWTRRCKEHGEACTGDKKHHWDSETDCDGRRESTGHVYANLREEFPHIFSDENYDRTFVYDAKAVGTTSPGSKHRIIPHRFTPPSGISVQDWLEMLQWGSGKDEPGTRAHHKIPTAGQKRQRGKRAERERANAGFSNEYFRRKRIMDE